MALIEDHAWWPSSSSSFLRLPGDPDSAACDMISLVHTFMVFPLLGLLDQHPVALRPRAPAVALRGGQHHRVHHQGGGARRRAGLSPRDAALRGDGTGVRPGGGDSPWSSQPGSVPTAFVWGMICGGAGISRSPSPSPCSSRPSTRSRSVAPLGAVPAPSARCGPLGMFFGGSIAGSRQAAPTPAMSAVPPPDPRPRSPSYLLVVVTFHRPPSASPLPSSFIPEDRGYFFVNAPAPARASLERSGARHGAARRRVLKDTPGVKYYTGVSGFSLLSAVSTTYNGFYFVSLEPCDERTEGAHHQRHHAGPEPAAGQRARRAGLRLRAAAIPGMGTAGGVTLHAGGPRGQGPRVPGREHGQVPRGRAQATRVLPGLHHAAAERAAALRRGGPGQGAQAGDRALLRVPDPPGVPGRHLRELLQPVRTGLAGVRPGRGRVPHQGRERRPVLCPQRQGRVGAALDAGLDEAGDGPEFTTRFNGYSAAQDQRHPGTRLQQPPGNAGARGGVRADHAARDGLRLLGHVVPGEGGGGGHPRGRHLRLLAAGGVPAPGRPVRELVAADRRAPRHAHRRLRRPRGALARPLQPGRLLADRPDHGDRPRRQERHPHRRVCQGGVRARRRARSTPRWRAPGSGSVPSS